MNDTTLAQLERLARLRAEGVLSATEYENAKRTVLSGQPEPADLDSSSLRPPKAGTLSKTWAFRFEFLSQHGLPHSPSFMAASKALPIWQRRSLAFSPLAFFFGPIYFFILGLWRPAVTLLVGYVLYGLLLEGLGFSDDLMRAAMLAYGALFALTCVPLYYLKQTRGIHRWNPFFWWSRVWR